MAKVNLKVVCGCGVIFTGEDYKKALEEAIKHAQTKKHTLTILGTIKPRPTVGVE